MWAMSYTSYTSIQLPLKLTSSIVMFLRQDLLLSGKVNSSKFELRIMYDIFVSENIVSFATKPGGCNSRG